MRRREGREKGKEERGGGSGERGRNGQTQKTKMNANGTPGAPQRREDPSLALTMPAFP
jgi:hypothetical protein